MIKIESECVCVYVCLSVSLYEGESVSVCVFARVCVGESVFVCVFVCVCVLVYIFFYCIGRSIIFLEFDKTFKVFRKINHKLWSMP